VGGSERGLREKWRKRGRVETQRLKVGELEKWRKREGWRQKEKKAYAVVKEDQKKKKKKKKKKKTDVSLATLTYMGKIWTFYCIVARP
jgi:hypothetical protein